MTPSPSRSYMFVLYLAIIERRHSPIPRRPHSAGGSSAPHDCWSENRAAAAAAIHALPAVASAPRLRSLPLVDTSRVVPEPAQGAIPLGARCCRCSSSHLLHNTPQDASPAITGDATRPAWGAMGGAAVCAVGGAAICRDAAGAPALSGTLERATVTTLHVEAGEDDGSGAGLRLAPADADSRVHAGPCPTGRCRPARSRAASSAGIFSM